MTRIAAPPDAFEKRPATVPRTGEGAVIHGDIFGQSIEKRRQQSGLILLRSLRQPRQRFGAAVQQPGNRRQAFRFARPADCRKTGKEKPVWRSSPSMPLRASATETTTAATSVKSVLSSATTSRPTVSAGASAALAAIFSGFITQIPGSRMSGCARHGNGNQLPGETCRKDAKQNGVQRQPIDISKTRRPLFYACPTAGFG